jgi:hypothetical protein
MANEVISYLEMCSREGTRLQRGMNFELGGDHSVVLMSVRPNAPYHDRLKDERLGSDIQTLRTPELMFRALLTKDGTQRLELART